MSTKDSMADWLGISIAAQIPTHGIKIQTRNLAEQKLNCGFILYASELENS